jgi:CBS domain-containing protein
VPRQTGTGAWLEHAIAERLTSPAARRNVKTHNNRCCRHAVPDARPEPVTTQQQGSNPIIMRIAIEEGTAMNKFLCKATFVMYAAALSPAAFAAVEDVQAIIQKVVVYSFILLLIVVAVGVSLKKMREDKRQTPLTRLFERHEPIFSVEPDISVAACVRKMTSEKLGALIIMEGEKLTGIFTERDALNKVLAAGLDPARTRVSEVMTKDPYCIPPTITVGEAMALVTKLRFRHLPIVENGKVVAVISSGDLTHWMVKDEAGEVQQLVDFGARP